MIRVTLAPTNETTRSYARTLNQAFKHTADYGCALQVYNSSFSFKLLFQYVLFVGTVCAMIVLFT